MFSTDIASCPSADTGQRLKMSEKSPRQPSVGDAEDRRRGARDKTIKLRRSLERISTDVLRIKVLDLADCLPLQASSWRDQEWQRWKGQVLRAFDVVPLAAAISTMFAHLVEEAIACQEQSTGAMQSAAETKALVEQWCRRCTCSSDLFDAISRIEGSDVSEQGSHKGADVRSRKRKRRKKGPYLSNSHRYRAERALKQDRGFINWQRIRLWFMQQSQPIHWLPTELMSTEPSSPAKALAQNRGSGAQRPARCLDKSQTASEASSASKRRTKSSTSRPYKTLSQGRRAGSTEPPAMRRASRSDLELHRPQSCSRTVPAAQHQRASKMSGARQVLAGTNQEQDPPRITVPEPSVSTTRADCARITSEFLHSMYFEEEGGEVTDLVRTGRGARSDRGVRALSVASTERAASSAGFRLMTSEQGKGKQAMEYEVQESEPSSCTRPTSPLGTLGFQLVRTRTLGCGRIACKVCGKIHHYRSKCPDPERDHSVQEGGGDGEDVPEGTRLLQALLSQGHITQTEHDDKYEELVALNRFVSRLACDRDHGDHGHQSFFARADAGGMEARPLQECNADGMECRDAERMNAGSDGSSRQTGLEVRHGSGSAESTQVEISECHTEHDDDQALQQREAYQEALIAPPRMGPSASEADDERHQPLPLDEIPTSPVSVTFSASPSPLCRAASPPPSQTWSEGATCLDGDGPSHLPGSDEESDEWVMDSEGELDVQISFNSRP